MDGDAGRVRRKRSEPLKNKTKAREKAKASGQESVAVSAPAAGQPIERQMRKRRKKKARAPANAEAVGQESPAASAPAVGALLHMPQVALLQPAQEVLPVPSLQHKDSRKQGKTASKKTTPTEKAKETKEKKKRQPRRENGAALDAEARKACIYFQDPSKFRKTQKAFISEASEHLRKLGWTCKSDIYRAALEKWTSSKARTSATQSASSFALVISRWKVLLVASRPLMYSI